jgi:hypothetical protein
MKVLDLLYWRPERQNGFFPSDPLLFARDFHGSSDQVVHGLGRRQGLAEKLFDPSEKAGAIRRLVCPHNNIYIRKRPFYQFRIFFDKGTQGHQAIGQVQGIQAIFGHGSDAFEDFFRRRQGGAAGAIDDADELQGLIFGIPLKKTPAFAHIGQTDHGGAVTVLGAVGAGYDADASHFKYSFRFLVFGFRQKKEIGGCY